MRAYVQGIGLLGPGLSGWQAGRTVLAGAEPYRPGRTLVPPSELLPPAERRRAGIPVKLALAVGREAFQGAGLDPALTASVFASSSGEGQILHELCEVLATPEREVSPTRFMNSVHNAAAGYWSIATRSREPSTSLCCFDASFAAGLLECVAQVAADERPVALVCYDEPYPEPLHGARALTSEFGVALVLAPAAASSSVAGIEVRVAQADPTETTLPDAGLEATRQGNPAARSLTLLAALARREAGEIVLNYTAGTALQVRVTPC